MTTNAGTVLWLTRAYSLKLTPVTGKSRKLARSAMASFWSSDPTWPPPITLETVLELGHSVPELQVTYIYSN